MNAQFVATNILGLNVGVFDVTARAGTSPLAIRKYTQKTDNDVNNNLSRAPSSILATFLSIILRNCELDGLLLHSLTAFIRSCIYLKCFDFFFIILLPFLSSINVISLFAHLTYVQLNKSLKYTSLKRPMLLLTFFV